MWSSRTIAFNRASAFIHVKDIESIGSLSEAVSSGIVGTLPGKVNTPNPSINVRGGPGVSYPVIGRLKRGEEIISVENSSWYKIDYAGETGYVSATYITLPTYITPVLNVAFYEN